MRPRFCHNSVLFSLQNTLNLILDFSNVWLRDRKHRIFIKCAENRRTSRLSRCKSIAGIQPRKQNHQNRFVFKSFPLQSFRISWPVVGFRSISPHDSIQIRIGRTIQLFNCNFGALARLMPCNAASTGVLELNESRHYSPDLVNWYQTTSRRRQVES